MGSVMSASPTGCLEKSPHLNHRESSKSNLDPTLPLVDLNVIRELVQVGLEDQVTSRHTNTPEYLQGICYMFNCCLPQSREDKLPFPMSSKEMEDFIGNTPEPQTSCRDRDGDLEEEFVSFSHDVTQLRFAAKFASWCK